MPGCWICRTRNREGSPALGLNLEYAGSGWVWVGGGPISLRYILFIFWFCSITSDNTPTAAMKCENSPRRRNKSKGKNEGKRVNKDRLPLSLVHRVLSEVRAQKLGNNNFVGEAEQPLKQLRKD